MLGEKIKFWRKNSKIDQRTLAKTLNVANGTISMWENNLRTPDLRTIKELAKVFKCSIYDLIDEEKKPEQVGPIVENVLSEDEKELLSITKHLSDNEINRLIGYAKSMQYKELTTEEKINKIFENKGDK